MISLSENNVSDKLRAVLRDAYLVDETAHLKSLLPQATLEASATRRVQDVARQLVSAVRVKNASSAGLDAFLHEYDLK